jgi:hypothetical protein
MPFYRVHRPFERITVITYVTLRPLGRHVNISSYPTNPTVTVISPKTCQPTQRRTSAFSRPPSKSTSEYPFPCDNRSLSRRQDFNLPENSSPIKCITKTNLLSRYLLTKKPKPIHQPAVSPDFSGRKSRD